MKLKQITLGICLAVGALGSVHAAVIASGSAPGTPGATTAGIPITVTGDGTTGLVQVNLDYDQTQITLAQANVTGVAAGFQCQVNQMTGMIVISGGSDTGPLPANTTICTVAYPVNAGAVLPLTLDLVGPICSTFDGNPTGQACTATDGQIQAGPPPVSPTLTYAPAPNAALTTVTFPGGAAGAATTTITVTPAGAANGGTTSVTACAISGQAGGGTFGAVTTTPANGVYSATAGTINLGCTRAATAGTATLTCTETQSDGTPGPTPRVWGLTCPAAAQNTYTATAALTFPSTLIGSSSAAQNIAVVAPGSNLSAVNITGCTFGGANAADFAFFPAQTFPQTVAAGATVNLPVRFTPAAAGARAGSVTCTTTNATAANFTTNFTGTGTAAAPNIGSVPTSGQTITLPSTIVGVNTSANVIFSNTGNATGTVSCAVTGTGFTVAPTTQQTVAIGGNQTFTVTASSLVAANLTGTLTCTVQGAAQPFTFPLSALVTQPLVSQIPAFGDFGRWALFGLIAGLGAMVAFRKRG